VCVQKHQAVTLIKKRGGQKFVCEVNVWVQCACLRICRFACRPTGPELSSWQGSHYIRTSDSSCSHYSRRMPVVNTLSLSLSLSIGAILLMLADIFLFPKHSSKPFFSMGHVAWLGSLAWFTVDCSHHKLWVNQRTQPASLCCREG